MRCGIWMGRSEMLLMIMQQLPAGIPVTPMHWPRSISSTLRKIPWENDLPFFLADFSDKEQHSVRYLSKNIIKENKTTSQSTAGYLPYFSQEFEWFNFMDNREELYKNNFRNLQPMTPGMFGYSILRASQEGIFLMSCLIC